VSSLLLNLLGLEPVLNNGGGTGLGGGGIGTLDIDGHVLVLLEAAGEVGLLGGDGGLGEVEDLDVAFGVGFLDDGGLVGLELAEVELLDEVGCCFCWLASLEKGIDTEEKQLRFEFGGFRVVLWCGMGWECRGGRSGFEG